MDANYVGNMDTRKSLSGFVFTLFGITISWKKNQSLLVALSTTQAENIAFYEWLKGIIEKLWISQECVKIHCDSQSSIHLENHQLYNENTKHIDNRFHFITEMIESKEIVV